MVAKVLIAHGNTQQLRECVRMMQSLGLDVVATPDGGDAFARFFDEDPELVLCSVELPSLSGPNFARMVTSQSPDTKVVLLAAAEGTEVVEGCPTLVEPLTFEALQAVLPDFPWPAKPSTEEGGDEAAGGATKTSSSNVFVVAALKRFQRDNNLLALLDDEGVNMMANIAKHQARKDGEMLIRQGDIGDGFFFLVEGQVKVTLDEKDGEEVARISAGGFFGEMALLHNQPRSASVITVGECTLLRFERDDVLPLLEHYPTIREVLSGVAMQRSEANLWRVLFDDDEVQSSFDSLQVGSADESDEAVEDESGTGLLGADEILADEDEDEAVALAQDPSSAGDESLGIDTAVGEGPSIADFDADVGDDDKGPKTLDLGEPDEFDDGSPDYTADQDADLQSAAKAASKGGFLSGLLLGAAAGLAIGLAVGPVLFQGAPALTEEIDDTQAAVADDAPKADGAEQDGTRPEPDAAQENAPDAAPKAEPAPEPEPEPAPEAEKDGVEASPQAQDGQKPIPKPSAYVAAQLLALRGVAPAEGQTLPIKPEDEAGKAERKKLRRWLMAAVSKGKDDEAAKVSRLFMLKFVGDWEVVYVAADSLRKTGKPEDALPLYEYFYRTFGGNLFVDDAMYWAAEIYRDHGHLDAARELYRKVLEDPKSNFKDSAQKRLSE